jgi:hypothetical protein
VDVYGLPRLHRSVLGSVTSFRCNSFITQGFYSGSVRMLYSAAMTLCGIHRIFNFFILILDINTSHPRQQDQQLETDISPAQLQQLPHPTNRESHALRLYIVHALRLDIVRIDCTRDLL